MLTFHHIGIACRDIAKTQAFYLGQGYTASPVVEDPLQHVRISFLEKEGAPRIELLEPLDDQSPVARTLATSGVSPYHMCYEVQDIESAVSASCLSMVPSLRVRWATGALPSFSRRIQGSSNWLRLNPDERNPADIHYSCL